MDTHYPPGRHSSNIPNNPEKAGGIEENNALQIEINAWAELLVDYYEYKRRRKIDAERGSSKMESKVETKTNKIRFPVK
jgi:hypothetical protein